jgi:tRNA (guanine-N7-)-methyltransferase
VRASHDLIVEPIGVELETLTQPIDLRALFGNDLPVELEIGMGKGTFLTDQAKARPQTNFIGIEWARWFWKYASDRLRRNACLNARTMRAEATYFVRNFLADAALRTVHIYFPDPWPKARHNKRRLIQAPFVVQLSRVLIPNGELRIVTDHLDYFQQIETVLRASTFKVQEYAPSTIAQEGEVVGTNFERKYRRQGRPFYTIQAQNTPKSS